MTDMVGLAGGLMTVAERNIVLFILIMTIVGISAMGIILVRFTANQIAAANEDRERGRKAYQDYISDLREQIHASHQALRMEREMSAKQHQKTTEALTQITESIRELHDKISRVELGVSNQK